MNLDFGHKLPLHVTMLPNPSHLEAVNPVSAGKARGRQLTLRDGCYGDSRDGLMGDKVGSHLKNKGNVVKKAKTEETLYLST